VVLYELFAGIPPFDGNSREEILRNRLKGNPEPLHRYNDEVSDAFSKLIASMLEKRISYRPADFSAVIRQLDHAGGILRER
jgi:serine/threonine protein kinase